MTEYEWDFRNRLTAVTELDDSENVLSSVEYAYDVFDRRISKSYDADGDGEGSAVVTRFVYDGLNIVLTFDGDQAADLTHRYLHGPAVDQILADEDANNDILWPLADHQGTIRDLIDDSGSVQNHLDYDAFGRVTAESNSSVDHLFAYTGCERDEETGLQYHRARYYDPSTGRWISEDPIGFAAGDGNLTRYVGNNAPNCCAPGGFGDATTGLPSDPSANASDAANQWNNGTQIEGQPPEVNRPYTDEFPLPDETTATDKMKTMFLGGLRDRILSAIPGVKAVELDAEFNSTSRTRTANNPTFSPRMAGNTHVSEGTKAVLDYGAKGAIEFNAAGGGFATSGVKGTLDRIKAGVKFPHRNDGTIFRNREGLLPAKPPGYYTEYVHPTPGVSGPGAQRIVIGNAGETYFTPDHYKTFIPVPLRVE